MLLWNLVYPSLVFLMFVFSLHLLLTGHGNLFLNRMLGILIMARGLQYLYGWVAESGHLKEVALLYKLPFVLFFIAPAAFYLYIKGFVSDRYSLGRHEWLHFLPGLIGLAEAVMWLRQPHAYRTAMLEQVDLQKSFFVQEDTGWMSPEASLLLRTGMFLLYVGLSWGYVFRTGILKTYRTNRVGCNWVLTLLVLATVGYGMLFYSMLWDRYNPEKHHAGFLGSVRFSILIYLCIMLFVFLRPRVLYGHAFVAAELDPPHGLRRELPEVWQAFKPQDDLKPSGTTAAPQAVVIQSLSTGPEDPPPVSRERLQEWRRAVLEHMDSEKPYLNPSFRLHHLAEALGIPPHHCSYLLNIEFGRNFNQWVNEYRVAHFIRLYADNASTLTLEALAVRSGFSNRRTLHNAFLRVHGVPPGAYFQQRRVDGPSADPSLG
jgi:AraC-like DNA-binding protein